MINYSNYLSDEGFAVFLLHGVIAKEKEGVRNYMRKHISRDDFVVFLQGLSAVGNPVSMEMVTEYIERGEKLPKCSFVITFDDGFENNVSVAAPILHDFNVPATFYITTDFVENQECSWIDRIEYAVDGSDRVALSLPFLGKDQVVATDNSSKIQLLNIIRQKVKTDAGLKPQLIADEVWMQLGIKHMELDPSLDLKMNPDQIRYLASDQLFTIGGHTKSHCILSHQSEKELYEETAGCLELLSQWCDQKIEHFSYPEGLSHCYSDNVIKVLRQQGIRCCPTAEDGLNSWNADLFHLKRITVV